MVLLSSPGGDLNQATIMGEIIRSRGLATAVGIPDTSGRVKPAYCASACLGLSQRISRVSDIASTMEDETPILVM